MNTPAPCDKCVHLYVDCMREDDPEYAAECAEGKTMGNINCPLLSPRIRRKIVHYIRKGHRKPVGCVVILDKDHIGFSLVHTKDQKENKFIAKKALYHFAKVRADDQQVMPLNGGLSESYNLFEAWCYVNGKELCMVPHEVRKILNLRCREVVRNEN